ncbi:MAG: nuclear transport factor 2 family protein [bacterium]|nr:nuclear transport factor 2 family protein [bacterium]
MREFSVSKTDKEYLGPRLLVMMTLTVLSAVVLPLTGGCASARTEPEVHIVNVLNAQADAWNRGDLDTFMAHYWPTEELTFSSGGQTTRGWQATLDSYRRRYPTPERMGRLRFDHLEIHPLPPTAALVLGRWHLDRPPDAGGPTGGNFSLIFRRIKERWLIVHDHTSVRKNVE